MNNDAQITLKAAGNVNAVTALNALQTSSGVLNFPVSQTFSLVRQLQVTPLLSLTLDDPTVPLIVGSSAQTVKVIATLNTPLFEDTAVQLLMPGYVVDVTGYDAGKTNYTFPGTGVVASHVFYVRIVSATTGPDRNYNAPVSVVVSSTVGFPSPGVQLDNLVAITILHLTQVLTFSAPFNGTTARIFGGQTLTLGLTLLSTPAAAAPVVVSIKRSPVSSYLTLSQDSFQFTSTSSLSASESVVAQTSTTSETEVWEVIVSSNGAILTFPYLTLQIEQVRAILIPHASLRALISSLF